MLSPLLLPVSLQARAQELTLRRAVEADLESLMELLSDDPISATRGDRADEADAAAYAAALHAILDDPSNELLLAVNASGEAVATMQLTRIPGMARRGATRLLVEAVRVRSTHRSGGIGEAMMRWVVDTAAPAMGASLVQLTSDQARTDAHRFYERLGFVGSHLGFKYQLR
ncbi:ribosomal protein S18 acetylase RimI-like enzyme [Homoserinimonas aerilata]|uniref:Ribosomal protein S18 acetylase RimI-like enzyme n=1 Tax=Homoserinimonas aerilata TaxID=1162970 RepID=A0A542YJA0_9MICO|nr:GNAT family N-acetyltransferase [Homoserinimonas aerilata]TQL48121.1 ribosomal protein S18 acetylase RimI-like enzyme [Homoserinimonas aerilata]